MMYNQIHAKADKTKRLSMKVISYKEQLVGKDNLHIPGMVIRFQKKHNKWKCTSKSQKMH
jgi:hypothetical protein